MDLMIRKSAGIFSPLMTSTISPLTSFSAGICVIFPSLSTLQAEGNMLLNPSIKASDFADCMKVIIPVIRITIMSTIPKTKLGTLLEG